MLASISQKIALFCLFTFSCGAHSIAQQPKDATEKYQKTILQRPDYYLYQFMSVETIFALGPWGNERVSRETENYIRAIAEEMGLCEYLEIRQMNAAALARFGNNNASAGDFTINFTQPAGASLRICFIYVNETHLKSLTPDAQRFLIGHEIAHIVHQHSTRKADFDKKFTQPALLLGGAFWIAHKLAIYLKKNNLVTPLAAGMVACFWGGPLGKLLYSRRCEKEADLLAAHKLNSAQGGVEFFKQRNKDTGALYRIICTILTPLDTHPAEHTRQAYLQKIADEQARRKAPEKELTQAAQAA